MTLYNHLWTGIQDRLSGMPAAVNIAVLSFVLLTIITPVNINAQSKPAVEKDTLPAHSITRAAIYSAVLPGLGQGYNRKYWKIPIIYAGFGVLGYFVISNNAEFKEYQEAYIYVANGETYPIDNPLVGKYNLTQLQDGMEFYQRNRDLSYIFCALWYTLNILEAYVDAHFFDYDVSEDLTLRISPAVVNNPVHALQPAPGLKLSLNF